MGRIGYLGISFGGGIGAVALAWEARIARGHLNVPTRRHHRLRRSVPATRSAAAVQQFVRAHPEAARTLGLCDPAIAARHLR